MTDHIRDSIDQLFPPEPPDDPRPEPAPPPDDALPEVPLPCPKCGAPGVCDDGWFVGCSDLDCTLPEMMLADWNLLSRAVALLRAVERVHTMMHARLTRMNVFINGAGDTVIEVIGEDDNWETFLVSPDPVGHTLPDALIALAARLEAPND